MATHGKKVKFWLGTAGAPTTPIDISANLTEVNFPRSKDEVESTGLGMEDKTFEAGYKDKTIGLNGNGDATIDAHLDGLYNIDTAVDFQYWPNGRPGNGTPSASQPRYTGAVKCLSYDQTSSTGDINKFTSNLRIEGAVTRAVA